MSSSNDIYRVIKAILLHFDCPFRDIFGSINIVNHNEILDSSFEATELNTFYCQLKMYI